ncbi:HD domain-containing phosphohydrolase [Aldersonia kunmingensis]|uniref:HD domain-containing phosphohydrolase n=1 Tax=Aldersonia kunmingensis TaxID=408066 RepID=UPI000835EF48|nr:HD domain-containing phosphohydrolase [Aldersonia kunmingensis]
MAELLASYSLALDLGLGQPMEHLLRAWQIADRLADHLETDVDRQSLFYISTLAWIGCVTDAPEVAAVFGDDIAFRADTYNADVGGLSGMRFFLGHAGAGGSSAMRLRSVATVVATGGRRIASGIQSHCLTTSALAGELGIGSGIGPALQQFFARWDGKGIPAGVGGADIDLGVRLFHLADVVEVYHRMSGVAAAVEVADARRGTQFDPELVDVFRAHAAEILPDDSNPSDPYELIRSAPRLAVPLTECEFDEALTALADFTDLRSPSRAGHSRGVSQLAGHAAELMRLPADVVTVTRRAGLVHDVGLHGVPSMILDKSGPLSQTEIERMRMATYYTERVLVRPEALGRVGAVAALAQERMDGSGHHRGLLGSAIPVPARILAAACAFRTLAEPHSGRSAMTAKQATTELRAEVRAGRLDGEATDAVLAASGSPSKRRSGPAGLTPREIEVLVMIARGATTNSVAHQLGIAKKTAGTHVERIYVKTGSTSRATATLFALRNGLIDPMDL